MMSRNTMRAWSSKYWCELATKEQMLRPCMSSITICTMPSRVLKASCKTGKPGCLPCTQCLQGCFHVCMSIKAIHTAIMTARRDLGKHCCLSQVACYFQDARKTVQPWSGQL